MGRDKKNATLVNVKEKGVNSQGCHYRKEGEMSRFFPL